MTRQDSIRKGPLEVQLELSIVGIVGFLAAWFVDTGGDGASFFIRLWVVDTGWLGTG